MGEGRIRVESISARPLFVPILADAFAAEWPGWCARVGRPAVEAIFVPGAAGSLPVVLVAHAGGELMGTIALRPWFGDEPMPETPWVRQLYVFPRHRGRDVDRVLSAAIERRARELGYPAIYAATNRIERLLTRRGWRVYRHVRHDGAPMTWMRKPIT